MRLKRIKLDNKRYNKYNYGDNICNEYEDFLKTIDKVSIF